MVQFYFCVDVRALEWNKGDGYWQPVVNSEIAIYNC